MLRLLLLSHEFPTQPLGRIAQVGVAMSGAGAGMMHGAGFGARKNEAANSLWGAAIIGPAARLELVRRLALWFE